MKISILIPSIVFATLGLSCSKNSAQKPNVLLINIDDLGWSDLGYNGSEYYETPNIDQLRSEGVYFPNGYAAASNSAPSRAAMMTGVYGSQNGVYTVNDPNRGKAETRKLIAAENHITPYAELQLLPQMLKQNGYTTCHAGKWHLGDDPTQQGFDRNIGGFIKGHPSSYFSPYNNPHLTDGEDGEHINDRITDDVINFIDERDPNSPFFIYYATYSVHTPLQAKAELVEKYRAKEPTAAHNNATYAAMIETMDGNLGRLLSCIKDRGLEQNTIIIFTSDNGGVYNISKQWPLRAGKGSFYEGGIRVPFIVKYGDRYQAGLTNNSPVSQMDIIPTLMELTSSAHSGIQPEGKSLAKILANGECITDRPLFWHFPAYLEDGNKECYDPIFRARPQSVIRKGDWKLIYHYEDEVYEMFNLRDDLSERRNVVDLYPDKFVELKQELSRWLERIDADVDLELNPKYRAR